MDSPRPKALNLSGALVEIALITIGVLIALSFDGLSTWRSNRALVREARANLQKEIRDNRSALEGALERAEKSADAMLAALDRLDPPQTAGQTQGQTVSLQLSMADLNSASRASAGLTGAMALMDYEEVKLYASVYSHQELFLETQKEAMQHLTRALGLADVFENPVGARAADLEVLKRDIRLCVAAILVEQQFGRSLLKEYDEVLQRHSSG